MNLAELGALADVERTRQDQFAARILCCASTPCLSCGGAGVHETFQALIAERGDDTRIDLVPTGCAGPCSRGPVVTVQVPGRPDIRYQRMTPDLARAILESLAPDDDAAPAAADAAGTDANADADPLADHELPGDLPFFTKQVKVVLANSGLIDPQRIEHYLARGGYQALARVVTELTPEEVCAQITRSGLRGRGGAGYPAGVKWNLVRKARGDKKYVVANGDEGDPGAYMDRTLMESDPHRVLEGMAIAGYAIGADQGYVYVRGEYPIAAQRLVKAIRQAERRGLLGSRILDSGFAFRVDVRIGAGAFVCGEETALMASIMGRRGQPNPRPPYPSEAGLWGAPTLINNVETFGNIAAIIERGPQWYASIGTEHSKGTKIFALAGKVATTGLVEVPMGITLREIVDEIGGGIPDGGTFKAAQTGGPSGGCIPAEYLDTPVDYDTLKALGSIMGSGGLIVMDDRSCMPDVAAFFMEFCAEESCGKCVPCRVGTAQMREILVGITRGTATAAELAQLDELCDLVRETSLCGLGRSAPNPVLSTLRYFREEYLAHVEQGVCPAGVCDLTGSRGSLTGLLAAHRAAGNRARG